MPYLTVCAECARTFSKNQFNCAQNAPDIFVNVESLVMQIEVDSTGSAVTAPTPPPPPPLTNLKCVAPDPQFPPLKIFLYTHMPKFMFLVDKILPKDVRALGPRLGLGPLTFVRFVRWELCSCLQVVFRRPECLNAYRFLQV